MVESRTQAPSVDGAKSERVADGRDRVFGQELSLGEVKLHAGLVQEDKLQELAAWKKLDVYTKRHARNVSKEIAQTRWVLTWEAVDGKKSAKALRTLILRRVMWTPQAA